MLSKIRINTNPQNYSIFALQALELFASPLTFSPQCKIDAQMPFAPAEPVASIANKLISL